MDWKTVASAVAQVAPGLCSAIGGPAGTVAGLGVKALCSFFEIDESAKDASKQVHEALARMTPEQAILLKKADSEFIVQMEQLDVDVFKLETEDRQSAREREIVLNDKTPRNLAYSILIIFCSIIIGLFLVNNLEISPWQQNLIAAAFGAVSTKVNTAFDYFLGSSKGSREKEIYRNGKV